MKEKIIQFCEHNDEIIDHEIYSYFYAVLFSIFYLLIFL